MSKAIFQPLSSYTEYPLEEMKQRCEGWELSQRLIIFLNSLKT